ncbi:DUF4238 domain-containing protein [Priestia aryabhattai]|uniref:DUF4238 domain-containing protein n=1 Tax=Priestia aryabhattai TaxID=412384 RepID=UPI00234EC9B8|nr:DUF4238 domain-containing protein [Priestia aryabhattai]MDC7767283.1 DUF4238 domain-containing protein [Priestia aryabhattai]
MGSKKKQHYVPKMYLRKFSNTTKSINTYNLHNEKYVKDASIKKMCQKDNFYGEDKKMEIFLDKEIETPAGAIINKILKTNEFPQDDEEYIQLMTFLLVSEARNLKNADSTNQLVNQLAKMRLNANDEFIKSEIDLDSFKIGLKEPANIMIQNALMVVPLILDLKPLLIVERTGARKFITSDNPLVRYNSFYLKNKYPSVYSFTSRGLQLFFPISDNKCILLYDSYIYNIKNADEGVLFLNRAKEVDQLNKLFYLNAYNNLFFNQKTKERYIENLHQNNKKNHVISDLDRELDVFEEGNSGYKIMHFSTNRVSQRIDFTFLKYTDYSKQLSFPSHMGGINRKESPFIQAELERKKLQDRTYFSLK